MIRPVIWPHPRFGWCVRVKETGSAPFGIDHVWGQTYGGGSTFPWWRPTYRMAERKAERIIRSVLRERHAKQAEEDAIRGAS